MDNETNVLLSMAVKGKENIMLKARVKRFIAETGMPVTVFCRRVSIVPSSYYRWHSGELNLAEETEARISALLEKFNF